MVKNQGESQLPGRWIEENIGHDTDQLCSLSLFLLMIPLGRSSTITMWERNNAEEEAEEKKMLHLLFGKGPLSSLAVCVVCSMLQHPSLAFRWGWSGPRAAPSFEGRYCHLATQRAVVCPSVCLCQSEALFVLGLTVPHLIPKVPSTLDNKVLLWFHP